MEEQQENKQVKQVDNNSLFAQMLNRLNAIFDRYMSQFPRYKELKEFMENDNNLYEDDGTLKDDYKKWINEVELFSKSHPIDETLFEEHKEDLVWSKVFSGIEKYIQSDFELSSIYEKAKAEEGETFDLEEWIYKQIRETSKDDNEADEKFNVLADMFSNETLNLLDRNAELRKILKDRVEEYGAE